MPEPESINTMFQKSFKHVGGDEYALRTGNVILPSGIPLQVNNLPLRSNSVLDSRAFIAPPAGTILAGFTAEELPAGYYSVLATWGNIKLQGGQDPGLVDITNFAAYAGGVKTDDLVALGNSATTIVGYYNFGGFDFSVRTKVDGSAGVAYMALIIATKISEPL